MATKSKHRKNHKQKVEARRKRLTQEKSRNEKMQREFIMNLIKQEQEKGLFNDTPSLNLPTDGPVIDGPVIDDPVIDGPIIDNSIVEVITPEVSATLQSPEIMSFVSHNLDNSNNDEVFIKVSPDGKSFQQVSSKEIVNDSEVEKK
jgi:hypothetical protein